MLIGLCIAFFIVIIDQLVKFWTITELSLHQSSPGINPIFEFYYIQNTGAGWGILEGRRWLFIIITVVIVSYLLYLMYHTDSKQKLTQIAYGLLIGGAIGNFIDRLLNGYVVDMIRLTFINFPIFNVADIALTLGVCCLIVMIIFNLEGNDKI